MSSEGKEVPKKENWFAKNKKAAAWIGLVVFLIICVVVLGLWLGDVFDSEESKAATAPPAATTTDDAQTTNSGVLVSRLRLQVGDEPAILNIPEMEVYDADDQKVPASMMIPTLAPQTDYDRFGPQYLLDGVYESRVGTQWMLPHTFLSTDGFMQLEMVEPTPVTRFVVYNRQDCCNNRVVGSDLLVYGAEGEEVCRARINTLADIYDLHISASGCELTTREMQTA